MNHLHRHEKSINPATVLIAATLLLLCGIALISRIQKLNTEQDWDLLIFTQQWPNTVCVEWEEKKTGNNCTLPKQKGHWTIHGIWPTKLGTKGPSFCNRSIPFDINALSDIKGDLDEYWTDIETGGGHKLNSFWKHEWLKHGTCAASLENLNTESKYFRQALKWFKDYNMIEVLGIKSIHPKGISDGYKVNEISDAVNTAIGKNPYIHCIHDSKTGLPFLSEIRICFDKDLILVDCDGIRLKRRPGSLAYKSILTNCPDGKPIVYPKNIPSSSRKLAPAKPEHYLVNFYKIILFLDWFSS